MIKRVLGYPVRRWVVIVVACMAIFAGTFWARQAEVGPVAVLWLTALPALVVLYRQNLLAVVFVALFCVVLGWWRGSVYVQRLAVHESLHLAKVTLVGRATEDAVYGDRAQLEFSLDAVQVVSPVQTPLVGSLTIRGFGERAVYRGDTVQVTGKLYPTRGNNLASVSFAELRVLERDHSWINNFRRHFAAGMQSALPEPVASFALGILIGQRSTLPEDTEDQLRQVGLTHIIAVSGYNLTIIIMACRRWLAKRSKYQATISCLALIGLFLLITGSSPPIVRAAIISLIGIGVWYYGRTIRPLALLLAAAGVTVLANPLYLWGNVSWYLSFLAFFGVLVLAPLVTKRLFGAKEPRMLVGIMIESLCASLLVLPYTLFIFGQTSLVSLPANVLVIPFIPFAMLLGLVAGLAGMFVPVVAGWYSWPANILMSYMLEVARLLSSVPHALVEGIGFPAAYMAVAYAVIGLVCIILWRKTGENGRITDKI